MKFTEYDYINGLQSPESETLRREKWNNRAVKIKSNDTIQFENKIIEKA